MHDPAALPPSEPEETPPALRSGSIRAMLVNTSWLLGGKGIGAVLSTIYLALATRTLGLEAFSQFALALAIAQTVAGLVAFQSWQIVVRYGMAHLHDGDHQAIARLLNFTTRLDVYGATAAIGLAFIGFLLLGPRFGWSDAFTWQALAATAALILSIRSAPLGILRLHDRFAAAAAAETVTPVVRFVGALGAWFLMPTPIGFLIAWSVAEVATAIAYWTAALRLPDVRWRLEQRFRWATVRGENAGILRFSLITNLSSSLDVGGKQVAVLLVGLVVAPVAAGGYRLAQQLASALAKFSQLLARAVFPELMRSAARSDPGADSFARLLIDTTRLAAIGAVIVVVVLLAIGRPAIELIGGEEFRSAYPVLLALGTAAAFDFAAVGFGPALIALGREDLPLKLRFVSTIVMLGLIVTLPNWLGATGAGIAVLIAAILSFALFGLAVRLLLRTRRAAET